MHKLCLERATKYVGRRALGEDVADESGSSIPSAASKNPGRVSHPTFPHAERG